MRSNEVINCLDRATARVEAEDWYLLEVNVSERCIAARLAMYLREYFRDYDVDVEYNRDALEAKWLHDLARDCPRDRHGDHRVLPDVIVHRRGCPDSNLLVIEMKKNPGKSSMNCARRRINAFQKELDYKFGALVVCKTGKESAISVDWYE